MVKMPIMDRIKRNNILIIALLAIIIILGTNLYFCSRVKVSGEPLGDFIKEAGENGLPVQYIEATRDRV